MPLQSKMQSWTGFQSQRNASTTRTGAALVHARDDAIVCDLSTYAVLSFEGDDAEAFLHAQLSSDVRNLARNQVQLATYNSPKGRVLATLTLWRTDGGFRLQLPTTIGESIHRRLATFILRSKVRAEVASDRFIRIGVGGPRAADALSAAGIASPPLFGLIRDPPVVVGDRCFTLDHVTQLPGDRFQLAVADPQTAVALWHALEAGGAAPADSSVWSWLTLRAGIAEIGPETQDRFVPQMLNYELVGAVSFSKGCYPGQEIIARTQYRGSIKRRTLLAHVGPGDAPAPGVDIFSSQNEQAIGTVVNAATAPAGGFDLLMCAHTELAAGTLHLGTPDGPPLAVLPMPYPIPDAP